MRRRWFGFLRFLPVVGLMGGAVGVASGISFFGTGDKSLRISDYPTGRVQAGTLSAGQRGLAIGHGGVVVAVWSDDREGRSNIYAVRSTDEGRTFGPSVRVNDAPGTAGLFGATVALDQQNRTSVVWFDERDGDHDIFFARGLDGGQGFTANVRVNDDKARPAIADEFVEDEFFDQDAGATGPAFQTLPSVAVDRHGTILVAWQDYRRNQADIYFARSTDGGRTFSPNVRVNDDLGRAGQLYPSLAVDGSGTIYLAWHDFRKGNQDIYFARSTDGGRTFSRNLRVNDDTGTAGQFNPSLAVNEHGEIYIAWHDLRSGNADIYTAVSRDGGLTFGRNIRVNDDQGDAFQFHPSLGINGRGDIAVAWEDYRNGEADIYLATSRDGGATFGPNVRVNDDRGTVNHLHASVAGAAENSLAVLWEDQRNEPEGIRGPCQPVHCADIYFMLVSD